VAESATPAQLIVKCLESEGVSVVFGIPGEENIHFVQALAGSTKIRHILTRHEQAASFTAEMYGRVTGHAAVVSAGCSLPDTSSTHPPIGGRPVTRETWLWGHPETFQ
jgi:thiamine pyrophosphate-dependent acetolactate synthase large subunit-like protein